jgi:hypothetical protein
MLTKEYIFVLRNFQVLHKLKKEDDLTSSGYLPMLNLCQPFTKPPLLQRSRLTGSGNPLFESCVEGKVQQREIHKADCHCM